MQCSKPRPVPSFWKIGGGIGTRPRFEADKDEVCTEYGDLQSEAVGRHGQPSSLRYG